MELTQFFIKYQPRKAINGQVLVEVLADFTKPDSIEIDPLCTIHTDGSSNKKGIGVRVIIENPINLKVEQVIEYQLKTTNSQLEYHYNKTVN